MKISICNELFKGWDIEKIFDYAARLGYDGVELARSSICPVQVMRIAGKPAYGTQFHGEMNRTQIRHRLLMYKDEYLESLEQVRRVVASLRPTVEARSLLRRFLELYT